MRLFRLYITDIAIIDKLIALVEKEFYVDLYKQTISTKTYCEIWSTRELANIECQAIELFMKLQLANVGIIEV